MLTAPSRNPQFLGGHELKPNKKAITVPIHMPNMTRKRKFTAFPQALLEKNASGNRYGRNSARSRRPTRLHRFMCILFAKNASFQACRSKP
jgi:hypothetical protein